MDSTLVDGDTDIAQRLVDGDPTVKFMLPVSDSHMDLEREILKIA